MDWLIALIIFVSGFLLGLILMSYLKRNQANSGREMAEKILAESEENKKEALNTIIDNIKNSFGNLSLEALSKSNTEFLRLAKEKLETEREFTSQEFGKKKELIDSQLHQMTAELNKVSGLISSLEKDRELKFGELTNQLKDAKEKTVELTKTTNNLREVLASTKTRGQWGQRMAEDVLRIAGFVEGVNYVKEKAIEGIGTRPDFTFFLPRDLRLNMDVKFPLENYVRYLNTENPIEKDQHCKSFLRDVKARIKEVTVRDYINPEQNTVDYVLLFIPNEQIYSFIHEKEQALLDESLKSKVVICSPMTLFAILAVVRQAVDNFTMEKTSNEILLLMDAFNKQWQLFVGKMDSLGSKIVSAQREFESLTTTRQRQLEKPLREIEGLKNRRGLISNKSDELEPDSPEIFVNSQDEDF
ncbi:MAG: DNA recombination protein RmuC [Candidatus Zixiibacteriota bacterium]